MIPRVDTIGAAERASLAEFLEGLANQLTNDETPPETACAEVSEQLTNLTVALREANDVKGGTTINDYDRSPSEGGFTIRSENN